MEKKKGKEKEKEKAKQKQKQKEKEKQKQKESKSFFSFLISITIYLCAGAVTGLASFISGLTQHTHAHAGNTVEGTSPSGSLGGASKVRIGGFSLAVKKQTILHEKEVCTRIR